MSTSTIAQCDKKKDQANITINQNNKEIEVPLVLPDGDLTNSAQTLIESKNTE